MTLESQYKSFKENNPDSTWTFDEWKMDLSARISAGFLKKDSPLTQLPPVEWLHENLYLASKNIHLHGEDYPQIIEGLLEKAKAMEKERAAQDFHRGVLCALQDRTSKTTRFEVIDDTGRAYVKYRCSIELSYQDDGKTLKIFVKS